MTIREKIQEFNPELKNIKGIRKYADVLNHEVINFKILSITSVDDVPNSPYWCIMFNIKEGCEHNVECVYTERTVYNIGRQKFFEKLPDYDTKCTKYKEI